MAATITVVGAGHGGLALAGHMSLKGFRVNLFSFFEKELEPVRQRGGIKLEGAVEGTATLAKLSSSIDQAIEDADLIIVVVPALAHHAMAALLSACLRDGQAVLLSPGRTGGALEFGKALKRFGIKAKVTVGECQTYLYATQTRGPAHVEVMAVKKKNWVAALPATETYRFLDILTPAFPQYIAARNVLETSLNNIGTVVHPAPMILNTGLLERSARGEDLRYYRDILTKTTCDEVLEKIDAEKVAVTRALGQNVVTARDWYRECYGVEGDTIHEVLQNNRPYLGYAAPKHLLEYYHILDEVPNSLVPMSSFGKISGVPTPMIDAIINLASAMVGVDFWREGRTVETLGLGGMTPEQMVALVEGR